MTTVEMAALAKRRLTLALAQPEGPYDHVANAIQLLLAAEDAFERLGLVDDSGSAVADVRDAIRAAQARMFKALFLLGSWEDR